MSNLSGCIKKIKNLPNIETMSYTTSINEFKNAYWNGICSLNAHLNIYMLIQENRLSVVEVQKQIEQLDILVGAKVQVENAIQQCIRAKDNYNYAVDQQRTENASAYYANEIDKANFVNNGSILYDSNKNWNVSSNSNSNSNDSNSLYQIYLNNKLQMNNIYNNLKDNINLISSTYLSNENHRSSGDVSLYSIDTNVVEENIEYILNDLKSELNLAIAELDNIKYKNVTYTISGFHPRSGSITKTINYSRATFKIINNIERLIKNIDNILSKIIAHKENIIAFEKGETVEIVLESKKKTQAVAESSEKTHTVKAGESLASISAKYNISWEELYKVNKGTIGNNPNMIFSGMKLNIPGLTVSTEINAYDTEIITNEVLDNQTMSSLGKLREYNDVMSTNWSVDADYMIKGEYNAFAETDQNGQMIDKSGDSIRISSYFGYRKDPYTYKTKYHKGTDLVGGYNDSGTAIKPVGEGVIVSAGWQSGYGNTVDVLHEVKDDNGNTTYAISKYAHMKNINVNVGDVVDCSDTLGGMGSTGRSTGVHLHLECASISIENKDIVNDLSGKDTEEIIKYINENRNNITYDYQDLGKYYKNQGLV